MQSLQLPWKSQRTVLKENALKLRIQNPIFDSQKEVSYIRAYEDALCIGKIKFHQSINVPTQGFIEKLKVNHAWRGEGIGYQLFKRAVYSMLAKGYTAVSWKAKDFTETVGINGIEAAYKAMIAKLRTEHNFIFAKCKRYIGEHSGKEIIPMKIIFKK